MKLKLIAACLMLLAFGCAQQEPANVDTSVDTSPAPTGTQLTSSTISFNVTGMT